MEFDDGTRKTVDVGPLLTGEMLDLPAGVDQPLSAARCRYIGTADLDSAILMKPQHHCNFFRILHELPPTFVARSSYHDLTCA